MEEEMSILLKSAKKGCGNAGHRLFKLKVGKSLKLKILCMFRCPSERDVRKTFVLRGIKNVCAFLQPSKREVRISPTPIDTKNVKNENIMTRHFFRDRE